MTASTARQLKFDAIGAPWVIDIESDISDELFAQASDDIAARIETFDQTYSRFRADSLVTKAASTAGQYTLPDDAEILLKFYRQLYDVTDGMVTPLIGDVLASAGYDAAYSLMPDKNISTADRWDDVLKYDHPILTVTQPAILDFGAAGKGYLVDIVGQILHDRGINNFMVDASGDILRRTTHGDSIRVGLEHPSDPTEAIGVAQLGSGSICASAGNRRTWAGLHHIMNPYTATPVTGVIATWVMAESTMLADGLATALFFTEASKLQAKFNFQFCLVRADYSSESSAGFAAELFEAAA